jgi:azurin
MKTLARFLALALVTSTVVTLSAAPKSAAARVVALKAGDDMKFSSISIAAKPGEPLQITLTSTGKIPKFAMAHNFVLLKKGTNAKAFADQAMKAQATGYIPAALKTQVLASTGLAGPGETVQVTFKVPTTPGKYEFICSFPGHFAAGMKGTLIVAGST